MAKMGATNPADNPGNFKPGHDPRRKLGRKRGKKDFRTILETLPQDITDMILKHQGTGLMMTPDQLYAIQLLQLSQDGDIVAIKTLGDRLLGKPTEKLEITPGAVGNELADARQKLENFIESKVISEEPAIEVKPLPDRAALPPTEGG